MRKEYWVMLLIIVGTALSVLIFVKKNYIRKAFLASMTAQLFTWPIGILLASLGKVEYPVRLFPKAVDSSFLHGYIMNPAIFAIYYVNYPRQAKSIYKCLFTLLVSAIPVLITVMEDVYTNLVVHKAWRGYHTWILTSILYVIIRIYLDWFFQNVPKQGVIDNEN